MKGLDTDPPSQFSTSAPKSGHATGSASATASIPSSSNTDHQSLGVGVEFLKDFVRGLDATFPDGWKSFTTKEICAKFVQPKTKKAGTAYYLFFLSLDSNASRHIQPATHFVSHAWKYPFSSVVETLIQFG